MNSVKKGNDECPRSWRIMDINKFVKYVCELVTVENLRVEDSVYRSALKNGLVYGDFERVLEHEILYDFARIALNNRMTTKQRDPRISHVAFVANASVCCLVCCVFDMGFAFRKGLEMLTAKRAVDVYSSVLKLTKTRSDAIVEHKLAIAKLLMEHEFAVKFEFTKLFESLAGGTTDKIVDGPAVQVKFNDLQSFYHKTSDFELDPHTQRLVVKPLANFIAIK